MRIYKRQVEIEGYGLFDEICNFSLKGYFSIVYPVKVVHGENSKVKAIDTDEVVSRDFEEVQKLFKQKVEEFELISYKSKLVIRYTLENTHCGADGSGVGLLFNWGVFKEISLDGSRVKHFFVRAAKAANTDILQDSVREILGGDMRGWKKMEYTDNAEKFFNLITNNLIDIKDKLEYFINNSEEALQALIEGASITNLEQLPSGK